jgi:hypothetical protein
MSYVSRRCSLVVSLISFHASPRRNDSVEVSDGIVLGLDPAPTHRWTRAFQRLAGAGEVVAVPAILSFVPYFALGRRVVPAVIGTGVLGGTAAAFLASAGSAMATSVDPSEAMLRGAGIGFVAGATIAAVLNALLKALRF